ncbi:hypothetical protein [Streptomyces sp. Y1]|uniref:Uncharacterized protein n=1 Tax=Streptomyces sp. Y1 TaxID=3238634 RepID=A0AB39TWY9_9ACTN
MDGGGHQRVEELLGQAGAFQQWLPRGSGQVPRAPVFGHVGRNPKVQQTGHFGCACTE